MEQQPTLIPNFTLFIQLAIFFACYFVLRILVFKPYLKLLYIRRERTTGLKEEALRAQEQAAKLRTDYETLMKSERKRIHQWSDEQRKAIEEEERNIVAAARSAAGDHLQIVRTGIQADAENARKQLVPLISEFSSHLASKVIGRKVTLSWTAQDVSKVNEAEQGLPTP